MVHIKKKEEKFKKNELASQALQSYFEAILLQRRSRMPSFTHVFWH